MSRSRYFPRPAFSFLRKEQSFTNRIARILRAMTYLAGSGAIKPGNGETFSRENNQLSGTNRWIAGRGITLEQQQNEQLDKCFESAIAAAEKAKLPL